MYAHASTDSFCCCGWELTHIGLMLSCLQVEPVMKTEYEDVWNWRVENDNKPLWTRSPKDVSEADYNEFFKQVGPISQGPATH